MNQPLVPELVRRSCDREQNGLALLEETRVISRLSDVGDVHVVGSFALGLVVAEDIDLLVMVDKVRRATLLRCAESLSSIGFGPVCEARWLGHGVARRFALRTPAIDRPPWRLDLCFSRRELYGADEIETYWQELRRQLWMGDRREIILGIKERLAAGAGTSVPSGRIYEYVLTEDRPSVAGFLSRGESP